jgi:hypothetical protein
MHRDERRERAQLAATLGRVNVTAERPVAHRSIGLPRRQRQRHWPIELGTRPAIRVDPFLRCERRIANNVKCPLNVNVNLRLTSAAIEQGDGGAFARRCCR